MGGPRLRWRVVIGLALAVALIALLRSRPEPAEPAAAAVPLRSAAVQMRAQAPPVDAVASRRPPAAPASATPECELKPAPPSASAAASSTAASAEAERVLREVDAALAVRPSERAAAARHYVAMIGAATQAAASQERSGVDCSKTSCWGAMDAAAESERNALVRLALHSRDPAVYAAAFHVCAHKREQDCQLISVEQWAQLDPHNAVPWLHLAAEAQARQDESNLAEAMHHVARASHSEMYENGVLGEALTAMPNVQPAAAQFAFATSVRGIAAAWAAPGMQTASRYCSAANTRDSNRQQLCSDVADTLFARSNSLVELSIGLRIGQRAGWPASKVAAAEAERDALMQVQLALSQPDAVAGDCANAVALVKQLRLWAERGETGGAREVMRRSGQSASEVAAAYRTERDKRAAQATAENVNPQPSQAAPSPGS